MGGPIGGRIPVIVINIIDAWDYLFILQDFPDFKQRNTKYVKDDYFSAYLKHNKNEATYQAPSLDLGPSLVLPSLEPVLA